MDKSVYNMKAEKIQKAVKNGDYETAVKICDTIDWSEVTSVRMLSLVSSVYEHVQNYDRAIDILLMAYESAPVGRRFLYKLTELALSAKSIREAEDYYRQFLQEAPDDNGKYILRYKLAEAKGEPLDKRITILEAYKRKEFDEEWAYRLAVLYHKSRQKERCVALCDEIILWFGVGTYVDKAMSLKEHYQELTDEQKERRSNKSYYEANLQRVSEEMNQLNGAAEKTADTVDEPQAAEEPLPEIREEAIEDIRPALEETELPRVAFTDETGADLVSSVDVTAFEAAEEEAGPEIMPQDNRTSETIRVDTAKELNATKVYKINNVNGMQVCDVVTQVIEADKLETAASGDGEGLEQMELNFEAASAEPAPAPETSMPASGDTIPITDVLPQIFGDNVIFRAAATPSEGMKAAVEIMKEAHRNRGEEPAPMARISAKKLEEKGILKSLKALKGRDLVILGAGAMSDNMLSELLDASELVQDKIFVLLDGPKGIRRLMSRIYPGGEPEETPAESREVPAEKPAAQTAAAAVIETEAASETAPAASEEPAPAVREAFRELQDREEVPAVFVRTETEEIRPAYEEVEDIRPAYIETEEIRPAYEEAEDIRPAYTETEEIRPAYEEAEDIRSADTETEEIRLAYEETEDIRPVLARAEDIPCGITEAEEIRLAFSETGDTYAKAEPDMGLTAAVLAQETGKHTAGEMERTLEESAEAIRNMIVSAERQDGMRARPIPKVQETVEELKQIEPEAGMSEDAFIDYIKEYVRKIDCVLADGAEDGIYDVVDELIEDGEPFTEKLAEDIVEDAADSAEKHSLGNMFKSKYDKDGNLILRAKNFY